MVGILETLVKAGAVFGLLAVTVKLLRRIDGGGRSRRGGGRARTGRLRQGGRLLDVVERTGVGRTATVVVVRVADEHWVLGVTDAGITRLGDVDLGEVQVETDGDTDRGDTDRGDTDRGDTDPRRPGAVIDLRPLGAPAVAWAERVRALRDRLPGREVAEDVTIPTIPSSGHGEHDDLADGAAAPVPAPDRSVDTDEVSA